MFHSSTFVFCGVVPFVRGRIPKRTIFSTAGSACAAETMLVMLAANVPDVITHHAISFTPHSTTTIFGFNANTSAANLAEICDVVCDPIPTLCVMYDVKDARYDQIVVDNADFVNFST